jgi:hypothetical protein
MTRGAGVVVLLCVVLSGPGAAQSGAFRFGLVSSSLKRVAPVTGAQEYSGLGWTLDGAFGVGIVTLGIRYLQSSLGNDSVAENTDLIEGETLLWVAPVRWANLGFGPHLRSYARDGATERWVLWELRARGNATLLSPRVSGYAELWTVVGGSLNSAAPFGGGRGLEGGLRLDYPRWPIGVPLIGRLPFSVRVRYRVERLTLEDDARTETVEQFGVAFGIGHR